MEIIKELFKSNKPDISKVDTYYIYQDGEILAVLNIHELTSIYGRYHIKLPVVNIENSLQIHVVAPNILWYDNNDVEYIGFTDTSLYDSKEILGFLTFCVGYSVETGYIYVDIEYCEKTGKFNILSDKKGFSGRGFQDIPIKVPDEILNNLLNICKPKILSLYGEDIEISPEKT